VLAVNRSGEKKLVDASNASIIRERKMAAMLFGRFWMAPRNFFRRAFAWRGSAKLCGRFSVALPRRPA
jgi:hypothetical protein